MTEHDVDPTPPPLRGACHCGAVRLRLAVAPTSVAECNCSLCSRVGGLWHHGPRAELEVEGGEHQVGYAQGDRTLTLWHCRTCGGTTHWTGNDPTLDRVGVNMRMFDRAAWESLPRRAIDGASW